jgi:predicted CoA-binding protein
MSFELRGQSESHDASAIGELLRSAHTIAVVGVSSRPDRDSHDVAAYLVRHGYRVIPVNPALGELFGEVAYPDLAAIPAALQIDVVDIFRRQEHIPAIVDQAIARRVRAVWLQLGLADEASARRARAAGLTVVMDRCIKVEHARLVARPHR